MKKILLFIIMFLAMLSTTLESSAELLYKIKPLCFDTSNNLLFIPINTSSKSVLNNDLVITKNKEKNSIILQLNHATTFPQPTDLTFSEGDLKSVKIMTDMNNSVTYTLSFKENYNIENLKIGNINNNICISIRPIQPYGMNYYLNTYTEEDNTSKQYRERLTVTSKIAQIGTPVSDTKGNKTTVNEINQAFINSTHQSSNIYTNYKLENETSDYMLRSKYYLNNVTTNGKLFTVSGIGILGFEKQFVLEDPSRMIFDIPNSIIKQELHNKEIELTNGDKIKVAQFEPTITRIVVTSKNASKYIPVYFPDSQKAILTLPQNLTMADIPNPKANITKSSYTKTEKLNNLVFEFDKPLVYSIKRTSDYLYIYFLNAEKFNEANFKSSIKATPYEDTAVAVMKNTGIRLTLPMPTKGDLNTYLSPEGRVFKISFETIKPAITQAKTAETELQKVKKKEGTIISTPKFNNPKGSKVIVLDAGHGGKDCGATREGIYEKDITLDVCDRIQELLQKKGYKVYMTRTNDVYVSLEDRSLFSASINPAIFVSVHVNACNDTAPKGIETHYYTDESLDLAVTVHNGLTKKIDETPNRGLSRSRFYVINHTEVPAILVEIGFLSNDEERNELITPRRKQRTAEGIVEGIIEYFNSKK